jgi:Zn-dependent peptidase ImmA (M78 family)
LNILTPSESLLIELGVSKPEEIDIDAIAYYRGVEVNYENIKGCEARLVGYKDRAIVTIKRNSAPTRKRFSIAHELGHWHHHRGRSFECRAEDIGEGYGSKPQEERIADQYAANLLLPSYIYRPIAQDYSRHSMESIKEIAGIFNTSPIASAIRFVDLNIVPSLVVCHGKHGRKWFNRSRDVPHRWFPKNELDADSFAFDVLFGGKYQSKPRKITADSWFDRREAEQYEIYEHTLISGNDVISLLILENERMLSD